MISGSSYNPLYLSTSNSGNLYTIVDTPALIEVRLEFTSSDADYSTLLIVGIYCKWIPDWIESTRARLNWYDLNINSIFRPIQSGIQEPNSKYYLEEYFNIAKSNHPHFILNILLQPYTESLVIEYLPDPSPQSTKLPQTESRAENTDFTRLFDH